MSGLTLRHSGQFCERDYVGRDRKFVRSWRDEQGAVNLEPASAPDHEIISAELTNGTNPPTAVTIQNKYMYNVSRTMRARKIKSKANETNSSTLVPCGTPSCCLEDNYIFNFQFIIIQSLELCDALLLGLLATFSGVSLMEDGRSH
jgi:hypothetical protein